VTISNHIWSVHELAESGVRRNGGIIPCMPDLSLPEKVSACISLAQFLGDMLKSRREVAWKVSVALWTLIAASTAFLIGNKIALLLFWVPVIVLLHYIC
jgi:hypothetical protein